MDFTLSPEIDAIRGRIRDFVDAHLSSPNAPEPTAR